MDLILSQLRLTPVNEKFTDKEQKVQWQQELNDWFEGLETFRDGDEYITEERLKTIELEEFNQIFGTNLKIN